MVGAASALLGATLIIGALWFGGGLGPLLIGMVAAAFGGIRFAFVTSQRDRQQP